MRYVLGIDLGTSSLKALLLREDGVPVGVAARGYPILAPHPGWAEQDPAAWWEALCAATREALEVSGVAGQQVESVQAVAVGGQMHGMVLLDDGGTPLRPAIIWPDQRSAAEAVAIDRALAERALTARLGGGVSPGFMLASLAWCRAGEPELWQRVARALLPKDYLRYRLTGVLASEPSDGCGIPLLDLLHWTWCRPALELCDLPPGLLPPLLASGDVAGTITAEAAAATGLRAGTPVYCGGSDQAMGALGAGLLQPGTLLLSISTGGQIVTPLTAPLPAPTQGLRTLCHALPGVYLALAATLGAGLSLRWWSEQLLGAASAAEAGLVDLVDLAGAAPVGAGGLLFLPYLAGERAPLLDSEASGVLVGLRLDHTRAHLARAGLEGVVFSLRHALEPLRAAGVHPGRIVLAGGLARSPLVQAVTAAVLAHPVEALRTGEQSALGAALLAATGAGFFPNLQAACTATIRYAAPVEPDPAHAELYEALYARYRALYPRLRDDMHALRLISG